MEHLIINMKELDDVVTLDRDEVIDRFFDLVPEEKALVRGLKIHKSMEGQKIEICGNKAKKRIISNQLMLGGAGIYLIYCIYNKKAYVGLSGNIIRRISTHSSSLNLGIHKNAHLQNAFNKYGAENFLVMQLESASDISTLGARECFWDSIYNDNGNGFNIAPTTPLTSTLRSFEYGLPSSKLSESEVEEICEYLNAGFSPIELAVEFDMTEVAISDIRRGYTWKPIGEKFLCDSLKAKYWERDARFTLNESDVASICDSLNKGESVESLSNMFKVEDKAIRNIRNGRSWRSIALKTLSDDVKRQFWESDARFKLDEAGVVEICLDINKGISVLEVCEKYELSKATVKNIRRGKSWNELGGLFLSDEIKKEFWNKEPLKLLSKDEVKEICHLLNDNVKPAKIAETYNISLTPIYNILGGKTFAEIGEKLLSKDVKDKYWDTNANTSFSNMDIEEICKHINKNLSLNDISKLYNVAAYIIGDIRSGRTWSSIGEACLSKEVKDKYWLKDCKIKLTKDIIVDICKDLNKGETIAEISLNYNIHQSTIGDIRAGRTWKAMGDDLLNDDIKKAYWKRLNSIK